MNIAFTKMHGLGNDFVVVDARMSPFAGTREMVRAMADRHRGIGFDQLLTVEPARDGRSAWYYGIWNADGDAVGQCGNGVRCVAAWLHREGILSTGEATLLESPSGPVGVCVRDAGRVSVNMREPQFDPADVPLVADAVADHYSFDVAGRSFDIGAVSMGNPHAVVEVDDLGDPSLEQWGPAITAHPRFPEQCNAGFVRRESSDAVSLRVHERGAGWTLACGTGACAAVAVLHRRGEVGDNVSVSLPGGMLDITWRGPGNPLWMTGPAAFAFTGEWPQI